MSNMRGLCWHLLPALTHRVQIHALSGEVFHANVRRDPCILQMGPRCSTLAASFNHEHDLRCAGQQMLHLYSELPIPEHICSSFQVVSEVRREIVIVFRGTKGKDQLFLEGWQSLQPGTDFYGIGKVLRQSLSHFELPIAGEQIFFPSTQHLVAQCANSAGRSTACGQF